MGVAGVCLPLHAWLHSGAIPVNDDDCALVAIAHGKVAAVICAAPAAILPIMGIEITPRLPFSPFCPASASFLPDVRGPPAFLLPS